MISHVRSSPTILRFCSCALPALLLLSSCTVSDTVVSRNTLDQPARARHLSHVGTTHWSYLWGLLQAENWDAECQGGSDMTRARVTTNPFFITISFLSLGLVVPQRLEWDCAPPARGTGTMIQCRLDKAPPTPFA